MKTRNFHIKVYLLIAILVVAATLRLNHITQPFIDIFSWRQSSTAMMAENFYRKNWNIFYPEVNWTGAGPNYQGREFQTVTYIAALLYMLVGQHDWVGRCVAVMFGLWGIFALYQLVRRVWDEEHALLSAAVMAVLPGSIFVERSFLPDPGMVSLVTTSVWMLIAYLQTKRWHYLLFAGIIGAWSFLTKIPGLIIGIPMLYAIFAILGRKRILNPKNLATIGVAAVLTLVPVIAYYLWARHLALSYPPHHFAGSSFWLWDSGLKSWWEQKYFLPKLYRHLNNWMWTQPIIALVFVGLFLRPPQWGKKPGSDTLPADGFEKAPWLFHWWLLAGVIYYIIGAKELVSNPWNLHLINPAGAALAGHAIIVIASFTNQIARSPSRAVRSVQSPASLATVAVILLIIGGFGQKNLKYMYFPSANEGYKMGLALREVSQSQDLVITLANDLGDPVAIYYSQRRGWVFPPAQPDKAWGQLPENDKEAIQLFKHLQEQGADWVGIVNKHKDTIWNEHRMLAEHIERTCKLKQESPEWVIYRILTPEEIAKLPAPAIRRLSYA
jgi:hypothetical protein